MKDGKRTLLVLAAPIFIMWFICGIGICAGKDEAKATDTMTLIAQSTEAEPAKDKPTETKKSTSDKGQVPVVPVTEVVVTDRRESAATTEGTKSYRSPAVTVGGKEPLNVREVPNSVSVITRQMMDDRNMVTPADALQQVTGVKMELGSDVYSNNYYARDTR